MFYFMTVSLSKYYCWSQLLLISMIMNKSIQREKSKSHVHNFGFHIVVMLLSTQIFADKDTPKVYFICNLVSIVMWNIQNGLLLAVVMFISSPSSLCCLIIPCACVCLFMFLEGKTKEYIIEQSHPRHAAQIKQAGICSGQHWHRKTTGGGCNKGIVSYCMG